MAALPDPAVLTELARVTRELTLLRNSIDGHGERLGALVAENAMLRARLESSEVARSDLLAQTEHILELLAAAQGELRDLKARSGDSSNG